MSYFSPDNSLLFDYTRRLLAARASRTPSTPSAASSLFLRGTSPTNLALWDSGGGRYHTTYERSFSPNSALSPTLSYTSPSGSTSRVETRTASPSQLLWSSLPRAQQAGLHSMQNSGLDPSSNPLLSKPPTSYATSAPTNPAVRPNRAPTRILYSSPTSYFSPRRPSASDLERT